ncbi:GIY-YIG nuclease family protein [Vibrio mediterranei]|uniref:GIY-YIG nuclease family protein n=1 Tax=Vibrio mediterranei TaxID=689 RepID=UPI0040692E9E
MSDNGFTINKHDARYFYIMYHIKSGTYKFGITNYIRDRIKQVNEGKPDGLTGWRYVCIIDAGKKEAFKLEIAMQKELEHFNLKTKWRGQRRGDCKELYRGMSSNTIRAKLRKFDYNWAMEYRERVFANPFDTTGMSFSDMFLAGIA